jgi:hypothetical protein
MASNGSLTRLLIAALQNAAGILIIFHFEYCIVSFTKNTVSIHTKAIHQAKLSGFFIFSHSSV